ncbi:uncharacterized protein LOC124154322 isoform X3 [Ischnura elegans]|uniref:uncharacterized protein LOC124154322 isoform X3 n=1 Tax=Ischnura elegans TaxID=197161 RepID=UPI001ED8B92B|nr:uncharacterized protein LOC124154322 isoform X3 [Ischnura elegans]
MDSTLTLLLGILLLGSIDESVCQRRRVRGGSGGVEFDCPEEFGYYPHPTDCTQYYVCVFGGALLESCTGGLMYSHELQTCDWPRNVGCGASSDHSSLSTIRVTDSRTRGDARSSTRPVTVAIPSREQVQQRRQEDFVKKQYPLYSEDSRVTPESAAREDEGPEGGERQQRVYRGQPSGLGPVSRDRDTIRHTGAVTNTIPASSISSSRGDKGVTYTLVQQQPQSQQQQLYRFPTGGHLVTAPRPSSYPLQWPPVSQAATATPQAYSPKLPPNRPSLPPVPAPSQRPPPSAPPPRPSLDPPLVSPAQSPQNFPSSSPQRTLGEFLGLSGVEVSGRDPSSFPSQSTDYRSHTTLSPDYRSLATPSSIKVYQNQVRPVVGSQGEQGVRTPYAANLQQPARLQHQQRAQFPPSAAANSGFLGDSRGSVKGQDGRSTGRQEGISQGSFRSLDGRNNDQFVEYRNVKDQKVDGRLPPTQGSRHSGHPVRIQIPIPNVNSAPAKPINFGRPQVRPSPSPQGNLAAEREPSSPFPNVLSQSAPIDTPSPVMRPPVYDTRSPSPEISPQIFVTPSYPQLPLSQRQPSQANRQIIPPNPSSHNYQSSNGNTVFVSQQQHQVTNLQKPAGQHTIDNSRVNEATLSRPQVPLPKEKGILENGRQPFRGDPVASTDYKNEKELSSSEEDEEERDKDDRYDDEEAYDDEYEDEEESLEEEQRKPNPFYGEHRFGPLLNEPNEEDRNSSPKPAKVSPNFSQSDFDFDAYLDRLREEVELGGQSQEKPLLKGTTSTQAPVTKQIDIKYLDNPFLAPTLQKQLGSVQQSHINDEISSTTKAIPVPKPILQEPFKPKESESTVGRNTAQRTKLQNEEQQQRLKVSSITSSTEKNFQNHYNKNPSAVKGHYILQDSPALPNKEGIKPTLIRIPVGVSRPTTTPKKNLVEVTTLHDEDELEDEEYDEYTEETASPHIPTESVPYRSGNHIGEGSRPWRIPLTSTESLYRNQVRPVTTTSTKAPTTSTTHMPTTTTTTTTTTLRPYIPPTRKSPQSSTTPKVATLGGSPRPTRPTRPPTPYRPTQRSRLRTTTSAPPKDQLDSKDEGVDSAQGNARYVADAGRQSRTRGKARPVDTSGYSDVEVSIESRPVQAQRARLVSTPATYNATTTTIYSSSVAPPVAQQYNPNYYALYDEDEVELYRDVDYSQVSGGRQTNVGTDSYRGQTNYKVQQVQQPEVVQQQSYLGRGNSNSYLSSQQQQQQQQQTYVQQDVQPDISYGGAALESPDYNDNYNSAEDNGDIQYNQTPQQQRPSVNRGSSSTRNQGRGSSQYSPSSGRQRPTLKPSTTIVSKAAEFIDIYRFPPSRPAPIYPQPRVDQAAAKCRKDICLLPDCNCGGKEVPGGLEPQNVPQIVLLTFDDSVNDLNKQLYSDLFEKGRKNPNGCPISATFYVSHEWTDYSQVQNLYAAGHEMASHSISHSFGEQFSQRKWSREINGQREILAAYGGVKLEDVRGMRAPFLAVGGNKMFKMLYDTNFTYDSSMPVYENRPPSWPYTFDYKIFHDCMIPPCPTRSYPGVWEVPMVMWQDLNGGRCSMGDACSNPPTSDGVYKMLIKNFERHYTTNRAPFGLYYHAAWFTQPHHKEGFEAFLDTIVAMDDVWLVTNWQAIQWVRDPTPLSHVKQFQPFGCNYPDRPRKCNNPKVCNLWHKSGVRYMRTCQPCPDVYPWTGKTGVKNSRADNEVED